MSAGKLRESLTFQRRSALDDGAGNTEGPFADLFTTAARVRPLRGAEQILAAKLVGNMSYEIMVRSSSLTRSLTTDDRAIDARDASIVYNLRTISNDDEHDEYLVIIAQTGVVT